MLAAPFFFKYAAMLEGKLGNHDRADALAVAYEQALDDPESPGVFVLRATLLDLRGRTAPALDLAERAVALDPGHVLAVRLRDRLRQRLERDG